MTPRPWQRLALPALLALGLLLRLGFGWRHPPQRPGEDIVSVDGYAELATSVAQSGSLRLDGRPSAYREPAYPVLLGTAFRVFWHCPRSYSWLQKDPLIAGTPPTCSSP